MELKTKEVQCKYCGKTITKIFDLRFGPTPSPPYVCDADECRTKKYYELIKDNG